MLGAATSGQAAKALGEGAGVSSSTVASLTWRLEHNRLALSPRHVLVLDEGAMTADADVGKLLAAVEASGSKLVAVGDFRQLGAVGPGGALEALAARHPGHVWTLMDNLRQRDPAERLALDHLRAGNLPAAVNWYVAEGRVHPARNAAHAMLEMIRAWAYDVAGGRDALLVAYHRDAVDMLNRAAREVWEKLGQLSGPELETPGGRRYRAGDRVITLSPGPRGAWVNSQRAVVKSVDLDRSSLVAVTSEGTELHMGPKDIGADQLGYSFGLTAHQAHGATVDATYALADGGGRELAHVAMSRARDESHVHVVAPNPAEAAQRVAWAWGHERRQRWVLDQDRRRQLANLYIERQDLRASVLPDRSADLGQARRQLASAEQDAADLRAGTGRWAYGPAGLAARALHQAEAEHQRVTQALEGRLGPWAKHKAGRQLREASAHLDIAKNEWDRAGQPYADQQETVRHQLATKAAQLKEAQRAYDTFMVEHPEVPRRLAELDQAFEQERELERGQHWELIRQREQARHFGVSHEIDNGLGIDL